MIYLDNFIFGKFLPSIALSDFTLARVHPKTADFEEYRYVSAWHAGTSHAVYFYIQSVVKSIKHDVFSLHTIRLNFSLSFFSLSLADGSEYLFQCKDEVSSGYCSAETCTTAELSNGLWPLPWIAGDPVFWTCKSSDPLCKAPVTVHTYFIS